MKSNHDLERGLILKACGRLKQKYVETCKKAKTKNIQTKICYEFSSKHVLCVYNFKLQDKKPVLCVYNFKL